MSSGWKTLLQQEGVSFSVVNSPDEATLGDFSVIIVTQRLTESWRESLQKYAAGGGSLLLAPESFHWLFDGSSVRRNVRTIIPEAASPFSAVNVLDVFGHCEIPDGAQYLHSESGLPTLLFNQIGEGTMLVLPFDAGELVMDRRSGYKNFYSTGASLPFELVSLISKGSIRQLVSSSLECLHHRRGLPYCHLWYFPDGVPNVFILRVDTDFASEEKVHTLYSVSEDNNVKLTWFVHTQSHERWLADFAKMPGHEIGVHCYKHAVLESYGPTRIDIIKALGLLHDAGVKPVGFAAPYGQLTNAVRRVTEEVGFLYSSEFSYDYDNFPSFPVFNGEEGNVLQIPVHPICIGSFRGTTSSSEDITAYFDRVISWKRATHEPLFFYYHPGDGHHPVLTKLMQRCKGSGTANMVMKDFAQWWKARQAASYSAEFNENNLSCVGSVPSSVYLRISRNSSEALVPFQSSIDMPSLTWKDKAVPTPLPADIGRIRQFSVRKARQSMQDFLTRERL